MGMSGFVPRPPEWQARALSIALCPSGLVSNLGYNRLYSASTDFVSSSPAQVRHISQSMLNNGESLFTSVYSDLKRTMRR